LLTRTLAFGVLFLRIRTGCPLFRLIRHAGALILARFVVSAPHNLMIAFKGLAEACKSDHLSILLE
jgi:hypothetical protein